MLGLATATALYCSMTNNSLKKAKRAFVNKIEDIIMQIRSQVHLSSITQIVYFINK